MKKIINILLIGLIAFAAFVLGARYSIRNIYIETLEPQEVPALERDGSNYYYAIYSQFYRNAIIY